MGLPWGLFGKESACQCRRRGFDSLGQEDPLEKGMDTHSSILAWRIPWRGAWWAKAPGVEKIQTGLSNSITTLWAENM